MPGGTALEVGTGILIAAAVLALLTLSGRVNTEESAAIAPGRNEIREVRT
ncbi:hypothetical protein [Mycolicibacterium celeriflavum]|uniref:Uncharacterized protein n=1 Tax=Mycolicibacterium celeriflavum TaxID=1249101 RepID=A0A7I7RNG6_MYCCF|nr:hypothetical protein [Mycolicibacterium celeriflavum]MCV7238566.1 hypothetical protein [Mycolicibacterium celeriflavum]BBY46128.1 hypothetical protein MCEL_44230 [Mycolicibacterium celeriflavum]